MSVNIAYDQRTFNRLLDLVLGTLKARSQNGANELNDKHVDDYHERDVID